MTSIPDGLFSRYSILWFILGAFFLLLSVERDGIESSKISLLISVVMAAVLCGLRAIFPKLYVVRFVLVAVLAPYLFSHKVTGKIRLWIARKKSSNPILKMNHKDDMGIGE